MKIRNMFPVWLRSSVVTVLGLALRYFSTNRVLEKIQPHHQSDGRREAVTSAEPDTAASLTVSVVTQSPQAMTAQQENARKKRRRAQAVKTTAGSTVEIKTSDYVLQPQYDYRDNRLPKIVGYDARNSVIVTLTDLKTWVRSLTQPRAPGANSIDGISLPAPNQSRTGPGTGRRNSAGDE